MRLAFYAPMKPHDHPVPSGDRNIARGLLAALRHIGAAVDTPSRLRTREGKGLVEEQNQIIVAAQQDVARILAHEAAQTWDAWITYHNYYKAPDLIGPAVSQQLNIPYFQVEATRAKKRLSGPWARFAAAAEAATDAAQGVFYFTQRDAFALRRDAPGGQQLFHLRPFLAQATLPPRGDGGRAMLSVGMMRAGDKAASYQIIADTLAQLTIRNWQLEIAGDGPARPQIEEMMRPFGDQVRFLGQLTPEALGKAYQRARLMFWPGVNEALGMIFLEAQAAGVPIVTQDRPGMNEVLAHPQNPAPDDGAEALASEIDAMLTNPELCRARGDAAREYISDHHLLDQAGETLLRGMASVGVTL